jgi:methionyl-tRNA synthetase
MNTQKKFYVTTPIYYVTAKPHLGSLYSTLLADVIARWHKLFGANIFFLTGTDEHGQKIAQAAAKESMEPKKFVDSFIGYYKEVWHQYRLEYTYFIRTTDTEHVKAVQLWLQKLIDKGDVYKAFYEGWYCTHCEAFVTEIPTELNTIPLCPLCARETVSLSEESYFFKLSAYQEKLLKFYEDNPEFIVPKERAQEVINFVKSGLRDLSISRTTITWGIPFPGSTKHVTYVWADALNNYITAIGYGQPGREKEFNY